MGIDIYCNWKNQTEAEKKGQYTGFSVTSGNVGYLREGYHGGPYVTKYLVAEAFAVKGDEVAKIPAKILRERLPTAVLMALYREKKVYRSTDPSVGDIKDLQKILTKVFSIETKDDIHISFAREVSPSEIEYAKMLIEKKMLPDYAQAFVDFVGICEAKEKDTGEPCEIIASY